MLKQGNTPHSIYLFKFALIVISLIDSNIRETFQLIIILENDKITPEVTNKLLRKGLSLIGLSDKEIIFRK
jgi:hypothetical protein